MEQSEITQLLCMLQEIIPAIKTLSDSQEQLCKEQAKLAQAYAETGKILERHAHVIVGITDHLGLAVMEESSPPQQPN